MDHRFKWKCWNYRVFKENIREYLWNLSVEEDFLEGTQKATIIKDKFINQTSSKLKTSAHQKTLLRKQISKP